VIKLVFIISQIIGALTILTVAFLIWLLLRRESSGEWVESSISPDGALAAKVFEFGAYAEYSRHEIHLRHRHNFWPFSTSVATLTNSKVNPCAGGLHLIWRSGGDELHIEFEQSEYTSVPDEKVRIGGRWVTVKLQPGHPKPTARCGSMKARS
jgi:hypothetical protein